MLNIVNKSPFERNSFDSCLRLAAKGSSVLLIEDGVYAALKGTTFSDRVVKAQSGGLKVYALQSDVEARGVQNRVLDGVTLVDYGGFVDLVTTSSKVHSWV